jgi:type I restriction enzyme S subunit
MAQPNEPVWTRTSIRNLESAGDIELGRGQIISQKDIDAIPGEYPVYSSSARGNGEFGRYGKFMFDEELVTWSVDGGGKFFYRPKGKFSITNVSGFLRVTAKDKLDTYYTWAHLFSIWETMTFNYAEKLHPSILRERFSFSHPGIAEQKKIASVLRVVQRAMEQQERALALTAELKKTLLQQLFTHGLRHEPQKESELGPIPQSWDLVPLGIVVDLFNGFAFKSGDAVSASNTQLVRMGNLYANRLDLSRSPLYYPDYFADRYQRFVLQNGDLIMSLTGTSGKEDYGFVVELPKLPKTLLLNQRVVKLTPTSAKLLKDFLLFFLLSRKFLDHLYPTAKGMKQANLSTNVMKKLLIAIPDMAEQREIAGCFRNLDAKLEVHRRKHAGLSALFRTLLHELMTARIRVHQLDLPELEAAVQE